MSNHESAIDRFRRRVVFLLVVKYGLALATVWAFLWGTIVLVLRATLAVPRPTLLWGLVGVVLALVPAILMALRRLPSRSAVRALLDQHGHYGGLLMAGEDHDVRPWRESLPEREEPRLRWEGSRAWYVAIAAMAFVVLTFAIPEHLAALGARQALEIGPQVEQLATQIKVLKEEKVLDPARAENLKKKLEQLRDDSSGKDPAKTLEALDHIQHMTTQTAKNAAESMAQKNEQLGKAETLTEALHQAALEAQDSKLNDQAIQDAMAELAGLMEKAAAESDATVELDPELLKDLKKGTKLSAADLKKLAAALANCKKGLNKKLGKLHKAKLLDAADLAKFEKCGECDADELADFLSKFG